MERLFLDANVLFSAAYRSEAGLQELWKLKRVVLCSSRYALEEARINLDEESQRVLLNRLSASLSLFDAQGHLPHGVLCRRKMLQFSSQQSRQRLHIFSPVTSATSALISDGRSQE